MKSISKLRGLATIFLLAAASSVAQLTSSNIATSVLVDSVRNDLNLGWLEADNPSFTAGGFLFEAIANPALGDFAVGSGELGTFYAQVSYLGHESVAPNYFGVSSELGGYLAADSILLFSGYAGSDPATSRLITAAEYTTADFWQYSATPGKEGSFWQDDQLSFRAWQYIDVVNNLQYTLFGTDDWRTNEIDFQDGAFLVVTNTVGIALQDVPGAVPEPSTYALIGAGLLVGIVALKRRKFSGGATAGIVS